MSYYDRPGTIRPRPTSLAPGSFHVVTLDELVPADVDETLDPDLYGPDGFDQDPEDDDDVRVGFAW